MGSSWWPLREERPISQQLTTPYAWEVVPNSWTEIRILDVLKYRVTSIHRIWNWRGVARILVSVNEAEVGDYYHAFVYTVDL